MAVALQFSDDFVLPGSAQSGFQKSL